MIKNILIAASLVLVATQAHAVDPLQPHRLVGSVTLIDVNKNRQMTTQYSVQHNNQDECNQSIKIIMDGGVFYKNSADPKQTTITLDKIGDLRCIQALF